jgi:hypothetical protein
VRAILFVYFHVEDVVSDEIQQWAKHSGVASIIEAIANWVRNYRYAVGLRAELAHCGAEEVAHIAHDLGMGPAEFTALAQRGPDAAYQLPRLLRALGVDPKELASVDPATMRAMERICITCGHKDQCEHDLAAGSAAESSYRDYCPNALSLNALFESRFEM